jgi:hypothetical protein
MDNPSKAIDDFRKAEKLWEALVIQAPHYVEFQQYLGQVRRDLKELE